MNSSPNEPLARCPSCGNHALPEFSAPPGIAVCPRCGALLRRSSQGMVSVGVSSEVLHSAVLARLRDAGLLQHSSEDHVRQVIAAKLAVDPQSMPAALADLGLDSLDIVELVMALEEEFGIDLKLP